MSERGAAVPRSPTMNEDMNDTDKRFYQQSDRRSQGHQQQEARKQASY
jgi:hypothetical protein